MTHREPAVSTRQQHCPTEDERPQSKFMRDVVTSRIRLRRICATIAGAALVPIFGIVGAPAATAATDDWTPSCSGWSQFDIWQVHDEWARVSHRSCIRWTTHTAKVQATTEFRADWPNIVSCSASLSKVTCASAVSKGPVLKLNANGLISLLNYNLGGTRPPDSRPVRCHTWRNVHKTWGFNGSAPRNVCLGPVLYIKDNTLGAYAVNSKHFGDRLNDGDGWKVLNPTGVHRIILQRTKGVTTLAI